MTEILFRGKRVDNGEWVEGGLLYTRSYTGTITDCVIVVLWEDCGTFSDVGVSYSVIPETVGQYIGKCDKHGNKIFTGQIVKYKRYYTYGGWETHTGKVDFDYCSYILTGKGSDCDFEIQFSNIASEEVEIIGTIHDNPELIKEGVDGNTASQK